MPAIKKGESRSNYVGRCIPAVMKEGGKGGQKHAIAKCYGMFRQHEKTGANYAANAPRMTFEALKEKLKPAENEEGEWRTIRGAHVLIKDGKITKGPHHLVGRPLGAAESHGKAGPHKEGFHSIERDAAGKYVGTEKEHEKRLAEMKVPPGWEHVYLSVSPSAKLQVLGRDSKGRTQYKYSTEHAGEAAAAKYSRVKQFIGLLPGIREKLHSDNSEEAAVLRLVDKTGFRIGSENDTGAEKQAYGASTLQGRHIKVKGDKVYAEFIGKKGVSIRQEIKDPAVAAELKKRAAGGAIGKEKLYNTTDAKVRDYLHGIAPGFKVKDFRTVVAAETALSALKTVTAPKTEKELSKAKLAVAKAVSDKLGNTPAVALKSYIPPEVFSAWEANVTPFTEVKNGNGNGKPGTQNSNGNGKLRAGGAAGGNEGHGGRGRIAAAPATFSAAEYPTTPRTFAGLNVRIENPAGSIRKGTDEKGKQWAVKMNHAYGFLARHKGADGEGLDIFLGPDEKAANVYVVHQNNPYTGQYDECKTMVGFPNGPAAKAAYLSNYDSPKFFRSMTEIPMETFKKMLTNGKPGGVHWKKKMGRAHETAAMFSAGPKFTFADLMTKLNGGIAKKNLSKLQGGVMFAAESNDGHWVTIHGAHVFIKGGKVEQGPPHLKDKKVWRDKHSISDLQSGDIVHTKEGNKVFDRRDVHTYSGGQTLYFKDGTNLEVKGNKIDASKIQKNNSRGKILVSGLKKYDIIHTENGDKELAENPKTEENKEHHYKYVVLKFTDGTELKFPKVSSHQITATKAFNSSGVTFAADDTAHWVTIGAQEGEDGKKHGGTPVEIGGSGQIKKGPAKLSGKNVSSLGKGKTAMHRRLETLGSNLKAAKAANKENSSNRISLLKERMAAIKARKAGQGESKETAQPISHGPAPAESKQPLQTEKQTAETKPENPHEKHPLFDKTTGGPIEPPPEPKAEETPETQAPGESTPALGGSGETMPTPQTETPGNMEGDNAPPMPGSGVMPDFPHQVPVSDYLNTYKQHRENNGLPVIASQAVNDHEKAVADALKAGHNVPPEVLKDYAHLQPPHAHQKQAEEIPSNEGIQPENAPQQTGDFLQRRRQRLHELMQQGMSQPRAIAQVTKEMGENPNANPVKPKGVVKPQAKEPDNGNQATATAPAAQPEPTGNTGNASPAAEEVEKPETVEKENPANAEPAVGIKGNMENQQINYAKESVAASKKALEEPFKRSMDDKPRADAQAYALTKTAHKLSTNAKKAEGGPGPIMDVHNQAKYAHKKAADAYRNVGDDYMAELHEAAAQSHANAINQIYNGVQKNKTETKPNETLLENKPAEQSAPQPAAQYAPDQGKALKARIAQLQSEAAAKGERLPFNQALEKAKTEILKKPSKEETAEADDEKSRREWSENASRVADNPSIATPKDLRRAAGYLSAKMNQIQQDAWSKGMQPNGQVIDGLKSEMDWYSRLADQKEAQAKPPVKKAEQAKVTLGGENAQPEENKPVETYINGSKARYTGKTSKAYGKTWYEVEFTDGFKKGRTQLVPSPPENPNQARNENAARNQAEWKREQEDYSRLAKATQPQSSKPAPPVQSQGKEAAEKEQATTPPEKKENDLPVVATDKVNGDEYEFAFQKTKDEEGNTYYQTVMRRKGGSGNWAPALHGRSKNLKEAHQRFAQRHDNHQNTDFHDPELKSVVDKHVAAKNAEREENERVENEKRQKEDTKSRHVNAIRELQNGVQKEYKRALRKAGILQLAEEGKAPPEQVKAIQSQLFRQHAERALPMLEKAYQETGDPIFKNQLDTWKSKIGNESTPVEQLKRKISKKK